ncbi:MAG: hypothetical protein ACK4ZJ_19280, partial [Allorhizobium sp.]
MAQDEGTRRNYYLLVEALRKEYTLRMEPWAIAQKLATMPRAPTQPLRAYAAELSALGKLIKASEADLVSYFTLGIEKDIAHHVIATGPTTLDQAVAVAARFEEYERKWNMRCAATPGVGSINQRLAELQRGRGRDEKRGARGSTRPPYHERPERARSFMPSPTTGTGHHREARLPLRWTEDGKPICLHCGKAG